MTDREIMQMALEALEVLTDNYDDNAVGIEIDAIIALRERLAQPEQEPVACIVKGCSNHRGEGLFIGELCSPCHTFITTGEGKYSQAYRNSQREWQGLFFDAVYEAWHSAGMDVLGGDWNTFASTLEDKLKEKND